MAPTPGPCWEYVQSQNNNNSNNWHDEAARMERNLVSGAAPPRGVADEGAASTDDMHCGSLCVFFCLCVGCQPFLGPRVWLRVGMGSGKCLMRRAAWCLTRPPRLHDWTDVRMGRDPLGAVKRRCGGWDFEWTRQRMWHHARHEDQFLHRRCIREPPSRAGIRTERRRLTALVESSRVRVGRRAW